MNIEVEIREVFKKEISELTKAEETIIPQIEPVIYAVYNCTGKVVVSGMGKSGHIARKISATMSSVGIPSFFLHPAEALHGDLGMLSEKDIIIFFSNSGRTDEISRLLPNIKMIGSKIIGISSHADSVLSQYSDIPVIFPIFEEAGRLNLAPTSSTTAQLVLGDAIAVTVSKMRHFKKESFALFHPAGALGKKLVTKIDDLMFKGKENAVVRKRTPLIDAINEMTTKGLGAVVIVDDSGKLSGIITDGDLRRALMSKIDIYNSIVDDIMTVSPLYIKCGELAVSALQIMERKEKSISVLPVVDANNTVIGMIRNHDIIQQNIFL